MTTTQDAIAYCEALTRHFTIVHPDPALATWYRNGAATLHSLCQPKPPTQHTPHTPGPWRVEDEFIFDARGLRIADTSIADEQEQAITDEQADANARLIAAAPDQHEALKIAAAKLASLDPQWWSKSPEGKRIRAAIAKAE